MIGRRIGQSVLIHFGSSSSIERVVIYSERSSVEIRTRVAEMEFDRTAIRRCGSATGSLWQYRVGARRGN